VRRRDLERIEEARGVVRHVLQRVRGVAGPPQQQLREARGLLVGEMRRAPDIAVVEADDPKALTGELLAELRIPPEHLRAEPHDQQDHGIARVAEGLIAELDGTDTDELLGHPATIFAALARSSHRASVWSAA